MHLDKLPNDLLTFIFGYDAGNGLTNAPIVNNKSREKALERVPNYDICNMGIEKSPTKANAISDCKYVLKLLRKIIAPF